MKHISLWMLAAILTCGSMLTSCDNDDNNIVPTPDEPVVLNCAKPDYLQVGDKVALISPSYYVYTGHHGSTDLIIRCFTFRRYHSRVTFVVLC